MTKLREVNTTTNRLLLFIGQGLVTSIDKISPVYNY